MEDLTKEKIEKIQQEMKRQYLGCVARAEKNLQPLFAEIESHIREQKLVPCIVGYGMDGRPLRVTVLKSEYQIPTFYVNKAKKTIVCKIGPFTSKVKLQEGDEWNEYAGMLAAYVKATLGLKYINKAKVYRVPCEEPKPKEPDAEAEKVKAE